jgi:lysine 2,3-aminomutase
MLHLLRQLNGTDVQKIPARSEVLSWMNRHQSGLDEEVLKWRAKNKERIIGVLIKKIEQEPSSNYKFGKGLNFSEKYKLVNKWWDKHTFHLKYSARTSDDLLLYLNNAVDEKRLEIIRAAEQKGIPIFATPYFLSLIDIRPQEEREVQYNDESLLSYLFYSQDLVEEFGSINAWEKEDIAEVGKPNAAGWVLPTHHIHRRYPEVAIFIPDTMGRACGGLCSYCQRMYDFQGGRFNFDLEKLRPKKGWHETLHEVMFYFRNDPYLEDILITGGDSLMSSDSSLKQILDAVLEMAEAKKLDNEKRADALVAAEFKRVRLGTKLPIYLPQRITPTLIKILKEFKEKATKIGIKQCIIQTHYSSAMEISEESAYAIKLLLETGWAVTNQQVFTVAASVRGHSAKLRQVLNNIGVLPYYTFTVKGFKENREVFANNSRSIQEQVEEKSIGRVDLRYYSSLRNFISEAKNMVENINTIRIADQIPFLATDRNMINLPGLGKSNTFRTIGITSDGRRILRFHFDHKRKHSPVADKLDSIVIIEVKSLYHYLKQLEVIGENLDDYQNIWGYSMGRVENKSSAFELNNY